MATQRERKPKIEMNDDFYPTASNLFAKNKQLTDFILPEIESGCRDAGGSFPAGRLCSSCAKYCPESDTGALNHSQMVKRC
mgnify:CR=1 FL=1